MCPERKPYLLRCLLITAFVFLTSSVASSALSGSVIGKIAGVSQDALSLQVAGENGRIVIHFLIGPGTRIDGELKIGVNAGVEYISLGTSNLAIRVIVDSPADPEEMRSILLVPLLSLESEGIAAS